MKVTRKRAIELQCHECLGHYVDGKNDCECVRCPLYTWMPYRRLQPDLAVFSLQERAKGKRLLSDKPERTDTQKAAAEKLGELNKGWNC